MDNNEQYVIMFNDYPSVVCPVGTTLEQANAVAARVKADYVETNKWNNINPAMLYIRPVNVRIQEI